MRPARNNVVAGPWVPKPRLIHGRSPTWWAANLVSLAPIVALVWLLAKWTRFL